MMVPGKLDCRMMGLRAFDICLYFLGLRARWLYSTNIAGLLGRFILIALLPSGVFLNECCFKFDCLPVLDFYIFA